MKRGTGQFFHWRPSPENTGEQNARIQDRREGLRQQRSVRPKAGRLFPKKGSGTRFPSVSGKASPKTADSGSSSASGRDGSSPEKLISGAKSEIGEGGSTTSRILDRNLRKSGSLSQETFGSPSLPEVARYTENRDSQELNSGLSRRSSRTITRPSSSPTRNSEMESGAGTSPSGAEMTSIRPRCNSRNLKDSLRRLTEGEAA